MVPPTTKWELQ
jgi:hypothetical protein